MLNKSNRNFGIGLLEIMLTISIIALIMVAVTRYYNLAKNELRITEATEVIKNVADASYKWVEGKPNFADLGTNDSGINILVTTGLLPTSYTTTSANPWLGTLTANSAQNGDQVSISLSLVPIEACRNLKAKLGKDAFSISDCGTDGVFSIKFAKP